MTEKINITKLARLASLSLDGCDTKALYAQLQETMEYASTLMELDGSPEELPQPVALSCLRVDIALPSPERSVILNNSSFVSDGFIAVPKIISDDN